MHMTVLAIDTAMGMCSVALIRHGTICFRIMEAMQRGQSERLIPAIQDQMAEKQVLFSEINAIAVTRGPGAFTGVRIGLAAARAFALARGIPCLGFTTFAVIERDVRDQGLLPPNSILVTVLETKRDDLYVAAVTEGGEVIIEMQTCSIADAVQHLPQDQPLLLVGDAAEKLMPALADRPARMLNVRDIDPVMLAQMASENVSNASKFPATPAYLRPPDVTMPSA
jgi:tRNA threonylcarbamoyladenosine biosynthesis protein TsaB